MFTPNIYQKKLKFLGSFCFKKHKIKRIPPTPPKKNLLLEPSFRGASLVLNFKTQN